MRYRFRGLIRTNGKAVEGHVEAPDPDGAVNALADNGIVTESLREEPQAADPGQAVAGGAALASAIDSALDSNSQQVAFDTLTQRYKGKSVWVIDREKIRRRVAEVVDAAMTQSVAHADTAVEARARVAEAINSLFKDNRNLTSQVSNTTVSLERQITRLGNFIAKAETVLAAINVAARSGGWGGGEGPRRHALAGPDRSQNEVLLEIFKSNLELRGISIDGLSGVPGEPPAAAEAPAGATAQTPAGAVAATKAPAAAPAAAPGHAPASAPATSAPAPAAPPQARLAPVPAPKRSSA